MVTFKINIAVLYALLIVTVACASGQNLIPNPSFESYVGCPSGISQIDSAYPWISPTRWGSPEHYHQCCNSGPVGIPSNSGGYQYPRTGLGYGGVILWMSYPLSEAREFIETPLISPLSPNTCYTFKMYVNLGNNSNCTTDAIGVYFSQTQVMGLNSYSLPYIPHITNNPGNFPDTLSWTLVTGNYLATGGESYLIIGNFNDSSTTNVMELHPMPTSRAYVLIDDVSLTECTQATGTGEKKSEEYLNVHPDPYNDLIKVMSNSDNEFEIIIYDILGAQMMHRQFLKDMVIETTAFREGIYLYELRHENKILRRGKFLKHK